MASKQWNNLPTFDELPKFHNFSGCAWDVWGKDDQLGTINLLTPEVVKEASQEIKTGITVCLNWPINFPDKPLFNRQTPLVQSFNKWGTVADDIIHINTQSGTQWDGMKHFGVLEHKVFYNNTPEDSFYRGYLSFSDPKQIDPEKIKYGIHNWAQHGIVGRGVLLDMVRYYTENTNKLPYDPITTHAIPLEDILGCMKKQGVTFKQGDILLLRVGFIQRFQNATQEERNSLAGKTETLAGIEQSEDMKRFLWNNHFAAVGSDQPALERWPTPEGTPHLHQTLLGLWGMPIGEMFDLEKLSQVCAEQNRYTFFFTSWPINNLGGVASPPNAAAYF
ncbi:Cyclase 1 superfamily protein [Abortiporus biennis]